MKVDLHNKVALVTGAAQGIGQAIADTLAANGARVVYSDLNEAGARAAAAGKPGAVALAMDVTDEARVNAVVSEIVRDLGRLDILVNNAGINTLVNRVTIDQFPSAEWDRIMDVDIRGVYLVTKAAGAVMVKQGAGRIINIASVVGLVPLRLQCAYVAAKAGVVNLTRGTAIELGSRGVLTNCIAPGNTLTEAARKLFYNSDGTFSDKANHFLTHIPLGRPGTVQEIAHAALFLAAPESSYINGAVLTVDGGWTAGFARDF